VRHRDWWAAGNRRRGGRGGGERERRGGGEEGGGREAGGEGVAEDRRVMQEKNVKYTTGVGEQEGKRRA